MCVDIGVSVVCVVIVVSVDSVVSVHRNAKLADIFFRDARSLIPLKYIIGFPLSDGSRCVSTLA